MAPRSIYAFGKRKARVWDAELRTPHGRFQATHAVKATAVAAVLADAAYVATAGTLEGHGCKLSAHSAREWCFVLPSGGAMCFSADDLGAALARVAHDYAYHPDCARFFRSTTRFVAALAGASE